MWVDGWIIKESQEVKVENSNWIVKIWNGMWELNGCRGCRGQCVDIVLCDLLKIKVEA